MIKGSRIKWEIPVDLYFKSCKNRWKFINRGIYLEVLILDNTQGLIVFVLKSVRITKYHFLSASKFTTKLALYPLTSPRASYIS